MHLLFRSIRPARPEAGTGDHDHVGLVGQPVQRSVRKRPARWRLIRRPVSPLAQEVRVDGKHKIKRHSIKLRRELCKL
jgi:hypothetical protein